MIIKTGFQKGHKGFRTKESYKKAAIKISLAKKGKKLSEKHKKSLQKPKSKTDLYKGNGLSGKEHPAWKGNGVSYRNLHTWVERKLGKPKSCSRCRNVSKSRYHWANKSGEYKRVVTDWIRLCVPCHKEFDKERGVLK